MLFVKMEILSLEKVIWKFGQVSAHVLGLRAWLN